MGAKREQLSKKMRFEIFKRDNFTCQYCGRKAPDIILQVDHINPVANGGKNEMLNLITSCRDCNLGKGAKPLNDTSVIDKQRKQLEELQERREQIEMIFEWKKSLDNLEDYSLKLLVDYLENIISPFSLSETGVSIINKLLRQFSINEIFDAIDKGKRYYLKYDYHNNLIETSISTFLNKIGGIIVNSRRGPIYSKINYLLGICNNRFGFFDREKAIRIFNEYVNALRNQGWNDEKILKDLETDVVNLCTSSKNWSEWRSSIENWTSDINNWSNSNSNEHSATSEIDATEIKELAESIAMDVVAFFEFVYYLAQVYGIKNQTELFQHYIEYINDYFDEQILAFKGEYIINGEKMGIEDLQPIPPMAKEIFYFAYTQQIDSGLKFYIDDLIYNYVPNWLDNLYLPNSAIHNEKDALLFKAFYDEQLKKELESQ